VERTSVESRRERTNMRAGVIAAFLLLVQSSAAAQSLTESAATASFDKSKTVHNEWLDALPS